MARKPLNERSVVVETYTINEAAGLTGLSEKSVRNRVDRGQLRVVKRDGLRRIPRSELKRAGLIREQEATQEGQDGGGGVVREPAVVGQLLDRLERQANQLGELRALTRQAESLRDERERLEAALAKAREAAQEARVRVAELEARLEGANRPSSRLQARLMAGLDQLRRLQLATAAPLRRTASQSRATKEARQ